MPMIGTCNALAQPTATSGQAFLPLVYPSSYAFLCIFEPPTQPAVLAVPLCMRHSPATSHVYYVQVHLAADAVHASTDWIATYCNSLLSIDQCMKSRTGAMLISQAILPSSPQPSATQSHKAACFKSPATPRKKGLLGCRVQLINTSNNTYGILLWHIM